jgi:2-methylisocitrate lyase-like PEP mutase family enzyme
MTPNAIEPVTPRSDAVPTSKRGHSMTRVADFRALHTGPAALLLPNVWDAGSARLFEHLGARAIATTSAGFAWACGWPDGDALPMDELLAATKRITRITRLPLSVDIEGGGSDRPEAVADTVLRLLDLGVAGINIEDGGGSPQALCAKIAAIRSRLAQTGGDLFVNARTDVYLRGLAKGQAAVEETLRRSAAYREAGCDGVFVPGLADMAAATSIASQIAPLPLNLMLVPGLPASDALHEAGVRRLSAGAQIAQQTLGHARELASQFLAGDWAGMRGTPMNYAEMNALLAGGS